MNDRLSDRIVFVVIFLLLAAAAVCIDAPTHLLPPPSKLFAKARTHIPLHPAVTPLILARFQVLSSLAPPPPQSNPVPSAADGKPRTAAAAASSTVQSDAASVVAPSHIGMASSWELDLLLQHFMRLSK